MLALKCVFASISLLNPNQLYPIIMQKVHFFSTKSFYTINMMFWKPLDLFLLPPICFCKLGGQCFSIIINSQPICVSWRLSTFRLGQITFYFLFQKYAINVNFKYMIIGFNLAPKFYTFIDVLKVVSMPSNIYFHYNTFWVLQLGFMIMY